MSETTARNIQVGAETGRIQLVITDRDVDDYLAAMEMDPSLFARDPASGKRQAPPELAPKLAMMALVQDYCLGVIGNNIRAKQGFTYLKPVWVGAPIHGVGKLVETYEKRGKQFVTFEAVFTDAEGEPLVIDRRTQLLLDDGFKLEKA